MKNFIVAIIAMFSATLFIGCNGEGCHQPKPTPTTQVMEDYTFHSRIENGNTVTTETYIVETLEK